MGIYGQGNAFNLSFSRQRPLGFGAVSTRRMPPPPPMGSFSQTINIKNGPSGFWGFMGGLMGGLSGTNMFGGMGCFGNMGGMGCFNSGFGNGIYGMLNQTPINQQAQNPIEDQKAKLKTIYSAYTVLDNGDGTFSLTKGDDTIYKKGTYKELTDAALEAGKTTPQGTEPKADAQPAATTQPQPAADQTPPTTTPEPAATTPELPGLKEGATIRAKDESNKNINSDKDLGKIKTIGENNDENYPKTITTTTEETLTFSEVKDGNAWYTTSTGERQAYRLTQDGNSIVLLQKENDAGAGEANWHR